MSPLQWLLRCVPGLSLIALSCFLELTLKIFRSIYYIVFDPVAAPPFDSNIVLLWIFAVYSTALHSTSIAFVARLCYAANKATWKIGREHRTADDDCALQGIARADEKTQTFVRQPAVDGTRNDRVPAVMAIIIPSYKEDVSTMEDTLNVLASHPMSRDCYHVFLAMEERDSNAVSVAQQLLSLFADRFLRLQYSVHPAGIPGEAPGKSSNVSWAAKEVEHFYKGRSEWKNVLVTTMDSDTHLLPQYFEYIRAAHIRDRKSKYPTDMALYMPPIVFDRNAHTVPRLVRVADLIWCAAGLSCFLSSPTSSDIGIPTSVYTIPLALVRFVDGWDTGPGAIGEDMHMMLKCYFATNGRLRIESVPSPASQCNISTSTQGLRGWISSHNARHGQSLRHMWGCLDTGYAIKKWLGMRKKTPTTVGPDVTLGDSPRLGPSRTGRPRKLSHPELTMKLEQYALLGGESRRWTLRNLTLFWRLFEAHFLPSHLLIVMLFSEAFSVLLRAPANQSREWLRLFINITALMRLAGFVFMMIYFLVFYQRYHHVCITAREYEMRKVGLVPSAPNSLMQRPSFESTSTLLSSDLSDQFSYRRRWDILYTVPDCLMFPVAGLLYGSVTLVQASLSHLWTEELMYLVSAKPVRNLLSSVNSTVGKLEADEEQGQLAV